MTTDGITTEPMAPAGPSRAPLPPGSIEEAGLSEEFLAGLLIKALQHRGSATGIELSDLLALPFGLLDGLIERLQERRLVQVLATKGPTRGEYVFSLTSDGRTRAAEELERSHYVGPAPVPFEDFCRWIERQTIESTRVSGSELRRALDGVVLPESMFDLLGPAINSGRSVFLYGESGNGKTLLAKRLARVFGERYFVPFSVLLDGTVMVVYDPVIHGLGRTDAAPREPDADGAPTDDVLQEILRVAPRHDQRYVEARRPVVMTGGELTLDHLDLQWDPSGRIYQAPPQIKAAGGVLVIDDLGRQRVEVPELLNRWVVPLEHRQDYLTLRSGRTVAMPFDCFVIFSTNLEPRALVDDAFLRRIHYKIKIADPTREEYESIFRTCCEERDIEFEQGALEYLFAQFYSNGDGPPRRCHPRDVLDHVRHLAEYRGEAASLTRDLLEPACQAYFLPSD